MTPKRPLSPALSTRIGTSSLGCKCSQLQVDAFEELSGPVVLRTEGLLRISASKAIVEDIKLELYSGKADGEEAPFTADSDSETASTQSLRTQCKNPRVRRFQKQSRRKAAARVRHAIVSADTGIASPPSERPMEGANFVEIASTLQTVFGIANELMLMRMLRITSVDELVPMRTPRLASASAFSTAFWPRTYHRDCFRREVQ